MGWVQRLLGRGAKRVTSNDEWIGATVTRGDVATSLSRGSRNGGTAEYVARAIQWVEICAQRNARNCSIQPLRLYVPARASGSSRSWTKRVEGRGRKAGLRRPVLGKLASYAEMAGEVEEVMDHPVLDLMHRPNPWMRGPELMYTTYYALELAGNRYLHAVCGQPSAVTELYPMAPQNVRIVIDDSDFIRGYAYGRESTAEVFFDPDEVLHSKHMPSLRNPYYGVSPLAAVMQEADLDAASTASEMARWKNDARPDYVLMVSKETPAANARAIAADIESRFKGVSNRGKFLVTGASDIKPLQWSAKEMEYIAGKTDAAARIWAAFGIPESELKLNDANLASSRTGSIQYMRTTIAPRINAQAEELTETLLPLFGIAPGEMWFCYDNPVPEDEAEEAATLSSLVSARILTTNEARAELGYDPIEGGDDIQPEAPLVGFDGSGSSNGNQSDGEPADKPMHENSEPDSQKMITLPPEFVEMCGKVHEAYKGFDKAVIAAATSGYEVRAGYPPLTECACSCGCGRKSKAARSLITKGIHEDGLNTTISLLFDSAVHRIYDQLNSVIPSVMTDGVIDAESLAKRLTSTLHSIQVPSMEIGWQKGVEEVRPMAPNSVRAALNTVPQYAIDAIKSRGVKVAGDVSGTVGQQVTDTIATALEQGVGRDEARRRVAAAMGEANMNRASVIADTEISRAYIAGNATVYKEAGVERTEWATAADPCPVCLDAQKRWNSKTMDIQATFSEIINGGYATLDAPKPPQHPRCRCSLLPIIPDSWGKVP